MHAAKRSRQFMAEPGRSAELVLSLSKGRLDKSGQLQKLGAALAGEEGFEPSLPDPESGVLPLDDSPVHGIL
jgi:hypothetical protein